METAMTAAAASGSLSASTVAAPSTDPRRELVVTPGGQRGADCLERTCESTGPPPLRLAVSGGMRAPLPSAHRRCSDGGQCPARPSTG
eukprot:13421635-Alexandrium_andersonii.AAC.1